MNLARFRNLAELDYVSTIHPLARKVREQQISTARSPVHRVGARLINRLVTSSPDIAAKLLGARSINEVKVIGSGAQMIVFREGNSVVKVDQRTLALSPEALKEAAESRQNKHNALRQYLGNVVLPETVSVEPHPLLPHRDVLVVRQRFQPFHDPRLFEPGSATPRLDAFEQTSKQQPRAWNQLGSFIEDSTQLFEATASLPDTAGASNLVVAVDSGQLRLIDGRPIIGSGPVQELIMQQFATISEQLQAA